MINLPPIKTSSPVKSELIADVSKTWKVGQVLNATAEQGGDALSKVLLRVGQQMLQAKTPIALQTGQDVKLLVKVAGDNLQGKPALLSILTPDNTRQLDSSSLATGKLRQFIAVQQSFTQLQQLSQQLLANKTMADTLSQSLKNNLIRLQNVLQIDAKDINTTQLKQQILDSGIFLESRLHKQTEPKNLLNDFKFQLLNIKSELTQLAHTQTGLRHTAEINLQAIKLQPGQLQELQTFILNNKNNNTVIIDKLVSLVPKQLLTQLSALLGGTSPLNGPLNPATPQTGSVDLKSLEQLLTRILQQPAQAQQNLQNFLQQLNFRLLLLDLSQQVDHSISKLTSFQLQPLSRDGDNLMLLLFNLVFKDNNEKFDIHFRIEQEQKKTAQTDESWLVTLSFNFRTLGKVQSKIHLIGEQISSVFHTELSSTMEKIQPMLPMLETSLSRAGLKVINLSVKNELFTEKPVVNERIHLLDENI